MRRMASLCLGLVTTGLGIIASTPAAADSSQGPGQRCADQNVFVIEYSASYPGATGASDGTYVRIIPTTGGCASSWAHGDGQLSNAAIAAQCRTGIEERLGPYPITVRFAQSYVLKNRADCIAVFSAVSHGEIDPGRAPLFPGGTP